MLEPGMYSLIYSGGDYRTIRIKYPRKGSNFEGRVILSIKEGRVFRGCGFLREDNSVYFWKSFRLANPPERILRITRAVQLVAANPKKAQAAYAMKEGRCCRCGRQLTVPCSLMNGMGPECANVSRWSKDNHREAFTWASSSAFRRQAQPLAMGVNSAMDAKDAA